MLLPIQSETINIHAVFTLADVPDDILEQLKWLKDGLDAINKWKDEVFVSQK